MNKRETANHMRKKLFYFSIFAIVSSLLLSVFLIRGFLNTYRKEPEEAANTGPVLSEDKTDVTEQIKTPDLPEAETEKDELSQKSEKQDSGIYRMLDFDRRLILEVGVQEDYLCSIFDLAYARAILDEDHEVDPYDYYDGDGADWRKAGFEEAALDDPLDIVLKRAYDYIKEGKPVLFYTSDIYGTSAGNAGSRRKAYEGHYVLLIGYKEDASYEDLRPSDFYAADSSAGYCCEAGSYMPWIFLTDEAPAKVSGEYALYVQTDETKVKTCLAYPDTCNWDADRKGPIHPAYVKDGGE